MTPTLPCPEVQQLTALLQGKIADTDAQTLRQHLQQCNKCTALAAKLTGDSSGTAHMEPGDQYATRHDTDAKDSPCTPPIEPSEIGRLGPYRLLRLLGRGGMGVVYHAEDVGLSRPVAIKVLKEELADQGDHWERFLREARTLASIKHEHVVTVYHTGREGKVAYLAMELLQGRSLAEHLATAGQLAVPEILRLGRELATGLAVVHSHGLIHRDIKPANVWVEAPKGRVKILDFGLARQVGDNARLTQTGVVVGTPAYMSPEQARGTEVDPRSDLFSFGCILYRLCTGIEPFRGSDTMSILMALAVDTPCPVEELNPAIPKALGDLVRQLLAKDPAERPASAQEVVERLETMETSQGKPAVLAHSSRITPSASDASATAVLEMPHGKAAFRLGLLLGGGLLAGVVGGLFALRTPAEPTRPPNEKANPVAEVAHEKATPTTSEDPDWQVQQRSKPVVQVPRNVPTKPTPVPDQQVREYLADWQPQVIGWPPDTAVGAKPAPNPTPAPLPPPPMPPPPKGPRGGPPRGEANGPPDGGLLVPLLGNGANGSTPAVEIPPSPLSFPYLSVNGKVAAHGIGVHASPRGKMVLRYTLDNRFDTFSTEVALNDTSPRSPVALTFAVYGDGERLWQSTPVTTRNHLQKCNVSVKGVTVLELTLTNPAGEPRSVAGAHGLWIDPQVLGRK